MKTMKYLAVCLVAFAAFSCSEEPLIRTAGDDEPIVIPPPKPTSPQTAPLDSLQN